jgi:hypothetical protein
MTFTKQQKIDILTLLDRITLQPREIEGFIKLVTSIKLWIEEEDKKDDKQK